MVACVFFAVAGVAQPDAHPDLLPPPPAFAGDWLVDPVDERAGVFVGSQGELVLDNGLVRRTFLLRDGSAACVGLDQRGTGQALLRAPRPECTLDLDQHTVAVGGLHGQPIENYLDPSWWSRLAADPQALRFVGWQTQPIQAAFSWKPRTQWLSVEPVWPPQGIDLVLRFAGQDATPGAGLEVDVHHELYDGLPLLGKWFVLRNRRAQPIRLRSFASELLAMVEGGSEVEPTLRPTLPDVHVETDCTMCGSTGQSANAATVRWLADPAYATQVNYERKTPCLLECRPPLGPDINIAPGADFESFRTFLLAFDGTDATRRALSLARMYRTLAPWVQENPLIFHQRASDDVSVRAAVDQAVAVGFEMVLLTFGSGFDIESRDTAYVERMRGLADYAHARGIAFGGYSLLASRSVGEAHDVVNAATGKPGGFARFGNSPCLGSAWGEDYFATLTKFFTSTGADVLEHDGSYPGDPCASTTHPGHVGHGDSYWRQRAQITEFYRLCRGQGIYLNVPDWYFLHGQSKTAMGYRETNWSLPRALQEIIERQNVHDGTRYKANTMGWMFVPLTEYHGGGAEATIEPLDAHRAHYEQRLANLLGAGVQACWRGPRLFDTEATKTVVKRWVTFYKRHRAILDSDLVPLRRADGRDYDGWLHVNPGLNECALAVLYNPLPEPIERTVALPLRYAGVDDGVLVRAGSVPGVDEAQETSLRVDRDRVLRLPVRIPTHGWTVLICEEP